MQLEQNLSTSVLELTALLVLLLVYVRKDVLLSNLRHAVAKDTNLSAYLVDVREADIVEIYYVPTIFLFLPFIALANLSLKKLNLLYV